MVRLYLTPSELNEMPLGIGLASSISTLGTNVIDKLLSRASVRCDSECKRRLQAPGSTTLAQPASPGATQISVASTLTLDELDEQAVQIGTGSTQETILVKSGGVTVTNWASPYAGTIDLASALQFSHNSGEAVVYLYKETTEAGSSSSSDPFTEAFLTQEAQIAEAHVGPLLHGGLTRVVFLKSYPIININSVEHAFSFDDEFRSVTSGRTIVPNEGWYRFDVGTVVMREGIMRTTYTGGFQNIPDDVKEACSLFFAVQMKLMNNPFGATELKLGKRTQKWSSGKDERDLVGEACRILKKYKRTV